MVDDTEEVTSIVIDNGSYNIRVGWSGNDAPEHTFRSCLGTLRQQARDRDIRTDGLVSKLDTFIGPDAQSNREILSLRYPIERGIVKNWEDMELIWQYLFDDVMRVQPCDYPVFITDAQYNPISNREKIAEVLFENFNVPACQMASSAQMLINGVLRTSLLVVDCGHGTTQTAMQWEGAQKPEVNQRRDFGGVDVTSYLQRLLSDEGYSFSTPYEYELVSDMKEKFCKFNPSQDSEVIFSLPGGEELTLNSRIFTQAAECIFDPSLAGFEHTDSVVDIIDEMLSKSGPDLTRDLQCNIIVSGGNSRMPGFADRLREELKSRLPHLKYIRVKSAGEHLDLYDNAVWIGGSIITSLSYFENVWIQKDLYNDYGPSIVNRRCL